MAKKRKTSDTTLIHAYHDAMKRVADKARELELVNVSEADYQEWTLEIQDTHAVAMTRIDQPGVNESYAFDLEYDFGLTDPKREKAFVELVENRAYLTASELVRLYKRLKDASGLRFRDSQSTPWEIALFYQAIVHAGLARVSFDGVVSIGVKRLSRYMNENPVMLLSQDEFVSMMLAAQNAVYVPKDVRLEDL